MQTLAPQALVNDHENVVRNAYLDANIQSHLHHLHSALNSGGGCGHNGDDVSVSDASLYFAAFPDNDLAANLSQYQYSMAPSFLDIPLSIDDNSSHPDDGITQHISDESRAVSSTPSQHYSVHSSREPLTHDDNDHDPIQTHNPFYVPLSCNGHPHTLLPPIVSPSDGSEPSAHFDADGTFNQRIARTVDSSIDQYARPFLQEQLGLEKWNVFSARLFERRLNHGKTKCAEPRAKRHCINDNNATTKSCGGASTIDFLVKVEVVKEVLRTYVPHPYNPLKSLTHPYAGSPTGHVTLTRSAILALSGWSNTQFSYWARRVEAVSVLAPHDERIRAVAEALKRRLSLQRVYSAPMSPSLLSSACTSTTTTPPGSPFQPDLPPDITGKGLDVIIEEVKKQTGQSQFLRGKHSSLDPFGSAPTEGSERISSGGCGGEGGVFNATFQAVAYTHSPPVTTAMIQGGKQQKRRMKRECEPLTEGPAQDGTLSGVNGEDAARLEAPLTAWVVDMLPQSDCATLTSTPLVRPVRVEGVVSYYNPASLNGTVVKRRPVRLPMVRSPRFGSCGEDLIRSSVTSRPLTDSENVLRKRKMSTDNIDMISTKKIRR